MSVDPKEQNAELQKLIGANKQRLEHTQKMLRDLHKRTAAENLKSLQKKSEHEKGE
jgi:hypothetical protein